MASFVPEGATASQPVTLELTSSATTAYLEEAFILQVTASEPITGPIKLYWTINGTGPYEFSAQIADGEYEREFGCGTWGNWTLWVVWQGDEEYGPAESNHVLVQAIPGEPEELPLLLIVGVVLVVLAAVVAVVMVRRSKKGKR
ncbi:MAG: hypothetical protein MUE65_07025 [Methanomassiliicoccales archaeon]|nr:hypothetical protein [Methanomassiliicoccales archaeon]